MSEHVEAEVAYRSTQYGIRLDGKIRGIAVGPAEAKRYRDAGVDVVERDRIDFVPTVSEWRTSTDATDGGAR